MQLNYQIQVTNVNKSGKYINRQKYNLHISVHCVNLQTHLLPLYNLPYKETAPQY